jgi:hypothetical protein
VVFFGPGLRMLLKNNAAHEERLRQWPIAVLPFRLARTRCVR